jgi:type II restriction/modification system DNA methylase subunit YeeA
MKIVTPVVLEPWERNWEIEKAAIAKQADRAKKTVSEAAKQRYYAFLERLAKFKVLDPACGSGNFLYLALRALKDFEKRVIHEAEALGMPTQFPRVGPEAVLGIEVNPYAAELARVTVWIGELQWMIENGFGASKNPILKPLNQIECRDAILNADGTESEWPQVDVIVGNPPFLGDKKLVRGLGQTYVDSLRRCYADRVPGGADLCCYWFEKLRHQLSSGFTARGGLVATDNIRSSPKNRTVLEAIEKTLKIFNAWTDQDWINEGAAVRVSLVNSSVADSDDVVRLNGLPVRHVRADLSASEGAKGDTHVIIALPENSGKAFSGITKKGPFDIPGTTARKMLLAIAGPDGRKNSEVLFPWKNGEAITGRDPDNWIISFGEMEEGQASLFPEPFEWVQQNVLPVRSASNSSMERRRWWLLARRAPDLFNAVRDLSRFLVTPEVSKYRIFSWLSGKVVPDKNLIVIARDDDETFGILQSRLHTLWALRVGTRLEDRPRYTSTTTFRTFPFPDGLTPDVPATQFALSPAARRVAAAAKQLNELRENWLNPPEWVDRIPEVVSGYPDRFQPKTVAAAGGLKGRTLTNLYNSNPPWLQHAHQELDAAVATAYGWGWPLADEEILKRLFALNQERAPL